MVMLCYEIEWYDTLDNSNSKKSLVYAHKMSEACEIFENEFRNIPQKMFKVCKCLGEMVNGDLKS